jgi:hypothetical protein
MEVCDGLDVVKTGRVSRAAVEQFLCEEEMF